MHTFVSAKGSVSEISTEIHCAPIVHESIVFNTLELALSDLIMMERGNETESRVLQAGVTGSVPVTSTKTLLLSFPQFTPQLRPPISQRVFGSIWSSYDSWKVEAVSDRFALCEAHILGSLFEPRCRLSFLEAQ
jgi:hypothetical protein